MGKDCYTKTEIKSFGFTDKMIQEMLSTPVLKPNPIYKSASPMQLWKCEEVDSVMKSDDFLAHVEKSKARKSGAKKAVETKRLKLQKEVDIKIQKILVEELPYKTLVQRTIQDKQSWYDYLNDLRGEYSPRIASDVDNKTKERWMVNYIRHNLTSYDDTLYDMSGKVGCHDEYKRYKNAVLDKIASVYPYLSKECIAQKVF